MSVTPVQIWYEDHLETDHVATVLRVLDAAEIAVPPNMSISTDFRKQAGVRSEQFVLRFREESA
jgi:LPS sulfotransferase NodH